MHSSKFPVRRRREPGATRARARRLRSTEASPLPLPPKLVKDAREGLMRSAEAIFRIVEDREPTQQ
jgi:hypothetical protein